MHESSARPSVAGSLGFILPTFPQRTDAPLTTQQLVETCRRAEEAGAGALWACDHLFWHGPSLECLTSVGVAAMATSHAAVGTCVLQLPLRNPPVVAKQAATLQHLSGGRFVLGVGIGTHRGEYQAAGVSYAGRGERLDDGLDALQRSWDTSTTRYQQLPRSKRVPVWLGGSSEAALRRAARRGDGWIPLFVPPEEYAAATGRLDKESERVGRHPAEVVRAIVAFVSVGARGAAERGRSWMSSLYGLSPKVFSRHLIAGRARQCAMSLARFVEAGAGHVAVFVTDDDPVEQFEDVAGEFLALTTCR